MQALKSIHLMDYDPAVNNGNWQWVASTGCDAQPYFRTLESKIGKAMYAPSASIFQRKYKGE